MIIWAQTLKTFRLTQTEKLKLKNVTLKGMDMILEKQHYLKSVEENCLFQKETMMCYLKNRRKKSQFKNNKLMLNSVA